MQTVPAVTTDQEGRQVDALQIVCPDCGDPNFQIFLVGKRQHQHLQCINVTCRHSFCDGSCVDLLD